MEFPENLKYTKDHEWLRLEGDTAIVGITAFAQRELGDIVYIDITGIGKSLKQHDTFGTVEAVKTVSDLFMPVSGKISEVNKNLDSAPESINKDPYEKGWMVKIVLENKSEVDGLLDPSDYKKLIGE